MGARDAHVIRAFVAAECTFVWNRNVGGYARRVPGRSSIACGSLCYRSGVVACVLYGVRMGRLRKLRSKTL